MNSGLYWGRPLTLYFESIEPTKCTSTWIIWVSEWKVLAQKSKKQQLGAAEAVLGGGGCWSLCGGSWARQTVEGNRLLRLLGLVLLLLTFNLLAVTAPRVGRYQHASPPPSRIGRARPGQMRYCKVTLAISLLNETTPTYLISALISTFVSSAWISRQQTTAPHCRFTLFTQIRLWCWMWRMWRWIKSKSMTSKLCPLKNNSSFVPASLSQAFFLGGRGWMQFTDFTSEDFRVIMLRI